LRSDRSAIAASIEEPLTHDRQDERLEPLASMLEGPFEKLGDPGGLAARVGPELSHTDAGGDRPERDVALPLAGAAARQKVRQTFRQPARCVGLLEGQAHRT
jgi:hypothetical protein